MIKVVGQFVDHHDGQLPAPWSRFDGRAGRHITGCWDIEDPLPLQSPRFKPEGYFINFWFLRTRPSTYLLGYSDYTSFPATTHRQVDNLLAISQKTGKWKSSWNVHTYLLRRITFPLVKISALFWFTVACKNVRQMVAYAVTVLPAAAVSPIPRMASNELICRLTSFRSMNTAIISEIEMALNKPVRCIQLNCSRNCSRSADNSRFEVDSMERNLEYFKVIRLGYAACRHVDCLELLDWQQRGRLGTQNTNAIHQTWLARAVVGFKSLVI